MEKTITDNKKEVVKISYEGSTIGKTLSSGLFDLFTLVVLVIIVLFGTLSLIQNDSRYKSILNERNDVLISSEVYVDNDGTTAKINDYLSSKDDMTNNEKSEYIDNRLTYYYLEFIDNNEETSSSMKGKGYTAYLQYKAKGSLGDGTLLFTSDYKRALPNSDYDDEYYSFYSDAVDTAIGYLQANSTYLRTRNTINRVNLWGIILTVFFCYLIIYLLFPLIFSRGKQTLGMRLTNLGLVQGDGLSLRLSRFLLRFLFDFVFIFCGSVLAFLIPFAITLTIIIVRKDHRSLTDYVLATYLVSIEQGGIYKDLPEFNNIERKRRRITDDENIALLQERPSGDKKGTDNQN